MQMRRIIALFISITLISSSSFAAVLILEGTYQLRNIFVMNGETEEGVGFCTTEVRVNGEITSDEINSSAFEIDLTQYGFRMGESVEVEIVHKDGCEPVVLNPGALKPNATFIIEEITVDKSGLISWKTSNEQGSLPYVVQQYKWNKWVNIGEVLGEGTSNLNQYRFQTGPVSGLNKFRVIQKSFEGKIRKSPEVSFKSDRAPVSFKYSKKSQTVSFSDETSFEIYNKYGQIVKRGFGNSIDVSALRKSNYYITFDNLTDEFVKK